MLRRGTRLVSASRRAFKGARAASSFTASEVARDPWTKFRYASLSVTRWIEDQCLAKRKKTDETHHPLGRRLPFGPKYTTLYFEI